MNNRMLIIAGLFLAGASQATELVYTPINPSFGGSALNGSYLLNKANAQNDHTATSDEKDFVSRFKESLERNIMNTITRGVASGEITDGTYDTGDFRIEVASIGGGVMLTITNLITGEVTVIEMPTYGG
ncbi:curli assembly protein CsgF [Shewanella fidelis]|uniref:Curli production assembly/transport component CsgF n=1 Tax=Shewanella fidelis TaxID=173509 RepID=A0AAW8NSG7_9GAMM|nr:curli assembly protein CsgF [Shewanella fidelis]MDR8525230.1 curli production assembly protein CsgF [Shewanella fidelis]MDW4811301.1 curli production assembly protein CsgF [Shewanella fidelis]MDW4814920.1 curli production assembly protein CsgF [Shewanella fidelis]MDW4819010.1 curli production assembly protein CsgF [Shewanella fidelis]MDW4823313.1 curli production assembly protein CsgF [Shewanella fidelis]